MAYSGNQSYDPLFLKNEIEDQFNSHVDLVQYVTVNNDLVGVEGDTVTIHKYKATNGTEDVTEGNGNTKEIEVSYESIPYTIKCAQNRFQWSDESEMKDATMVLTGHRHMGTDMFNHEMADIYAEFMKAPMVICASKYDFASFADAVSMMDAEGAENLNVFAFINREDEANVRKELGLSLQYVQAHATKGYIGTVAGVRVIVKKDVPAGSVAVATKDAVTLFNKKGTELETERDANSRLTTDYSRKYYIPALTDDRFAVRILKGATAAKTEDSEIVSGKTYYAADGLGFIAVANPVVGDIDDYYEITLAA